MNISGSENSLARVSKKSIPGTSAILAVMPILTIYKIPGLTSNYGMGVALLMVLISFFLSLKIEIPSELSKFLVVYILLDAYYSHVSGLEYITALNRTIGAIFYTVAVSVIAKNFKIKEFILVYEAVVIASCIALFYQAMVIQNGGVVRPISLPIPTDEVLLDRELARPVSFFTEPQSFSTYVLPLFILYLHGKRWIRAAVLYAAIILSTSTFGLATATLLILQYAIKKKGLGSYVHILIFGTITMIAYHLFADSKLIEYTVNKILNEDYSTQIRLVKGYLIFSQLDKWQMMFGIRQSVEEMLTSNMTIFPWVLAYVGTESEHLINYLATVQDILVKFGIAGVLLFVLYMNALKNKCKNEITQSLWLLFLISSFVSTNLFNGAFVFNIALIYGFQRITKKDQSI